ncbi:MAG TPA: methyltransferase domain-containing protein [Candidatus Acidoferrum sp.]|nr:methyltransferase domain-containing protein [Candidatus Acidoferrum sp.]
MPYTRIDHFIARLRFRAAYPYIRPGSRVCDLGCGLEAAFLDYASDRIATGVGVDDQVADGVQGRWQRVRGDLRFPLPLPDGNFDHVVMLAVLEHLTEPEKVLREAHRVIVPGGSLIMTWPSAMVDPILDMLHRLHLISDEMESDEHQERIPVEALQEMLQRIGFQKFVHRRFEFGLNNLMVAFR